MMQPVRRRWRAGRRIQVGAGQIVEIAPPYPLIRNRLRQGRVIPFLGAGASFGARDPGTVPWRRRKAAAQDQWDMSFLPTGGELAECLAHEVQFPQGETRELTKVAQYFAVSAGRDPLEE